MRLRYYILRRIITSFATLILVILVSYIIMYVGLIERPLFIREEYGVEGFFPYLFFKFLISILSGNWGINTGIQTELFRYPFTTIIAFLLPYTLQLIIGSLIVSLAIAIPVGSRIAIRRNGVGDYSARIWSFASYGMPIVFSSYFILLLFANGGILGTKFPDTGMYTITSQPPPFLYNGITNPTHFAILDGLINGDFQFAYSAFIHLILPTMVLSIWTSAALIRFMRNNVLDSISEPYVLAAYSRGLSERRVNSKYVRRNSYIPFVTVIGPLYSGLIGWAVIVEFVFGYKGIGYFMLLSAYSLYIRGLAICLMVLGLTVIILNFLTDIIYAFLDPRIRY